MYGSLKAATRNISFLVFFSFLPSSRRSRGKSGETTRYSFALQSIQIKRHRAITVVSVCKIRPLVHARGECIHGSVQGELERESYNCVCVVTL